MFAVHKRWFLFMVLLLCCVGMHNQALGQDPPAPRPGVPTTQKSQKVTKARSTQPTRRISPTQRKPPVRRVQKSKVVKKAPKKDNSIQKQLAQQFVREIWSKGPIFGLIILFWFGFLVSLTPCVYPMIPVTIAVIGASRSESDHKGSFVLASVYVIGMAVPYSILGAVVAFIGRQPIVLGSIFNSTYFLLFLVSLFGLMSLSMFGLFDLSLPSSWQTKLAGYQGKGYAGIFVLGVIGALLATPCSGPVIVGLLAFIAQLSADPNVSQLSSLWMGLTLPFVFSLGVGVPFLVLGGGVVKALPRSGTWMMEVKKVFGVVLLATTFYYAYFLMRQQREWFIVLFGVTSIMLGVFAGAFRPYAKGTWWWDSMKQTFGIVCILVGVYLVMGSLLSKGFLLPPLKVPSRAAPSPNTSSKAVYDPCLPPSTHPKNKPFWFKDEKKALVCAKKLNRPVIIDFWAEWCGSCKRLERESFNHPIATKETKRFIMIKYEYNEKTAEDKRLRKKYSIPGLPWVRFIDSKGKLLENPRLVGFVKHDKLLKLMQRVK